MKHLLTRVFALLLALAGTASADIYLYLDPSTAGDPYMILEGDASTLEGLPVERGDLAALGWLLTDFDGRFRGYVEKQYVGPGDAVAAGAVVHFAPDADSSVITTVQEGDTMRLLYVGEWAQVEFEKNITLYYNPALGGSAAALPPAPKSSGAKLSNKPVASKRAVAKADPDQTLLGNETALDAGIDLQIDEAMPVVDVPVVAQQPAKPVKPIEHGYALDAVSDYEGYLRLTNKAQQRRTGLGLQLKSISGDRRVAFVDLSNSPVMPIEAYLDQVVIIHGNMAKSEVHGNKVVLFARTIRKP